MLHKNKYKEKYIDMKGHYEGSGMDKRTMHAMKARTLASDVSDEVPVSQMNECQS